MNLVSHVHEMAMTQPDKAAYHFMGQDTSYAEFDRAVSKFASALQNLGVEKGDHVAFLLGNTPHFLISLYATMRLGATAIPVNPIYTPDEIYYILHNSDAKAVIALDLLLPLVEQVTDKFPAVEQFIICETVPETPSKVEALPDAVKAKVHLFTSLLNAGKPDVQPTEVDAGETAIILYTSGTTGQPKGAMLTHGNIYSNARDVADFLGFIGTGSRRGDIASLSCIRIDGRREYAAIPGRDSLTRTTLQPCGYIFVDQRTAGIRICRCTNYVQFPVPIPGGESRRFPVNPYGYFRWDLVTCCIAT